MNRFILTALILGAIATGLQQRAQAADEQAKPANASAEAVTNSEKKAAEESHFKVNANGNVVITVTAETQQRIGLKVEMPAATELPPEAKAYGSVLDPMPLATGINDLAAAEAACNASQKELERLKNLKAQGNASDRALQAAEAVALRDELLVRSAKDRLTLAWGNVVADQRNFNGFVRSLTSLEAALVRLNLTAGVNVKTNPMGARVITLSGDSVEAQFLGVASTVDPLTQGRGFIFIVRTNEAGLKPGESLTGRIQLAGQPGKGVTIPSAAVVRFEGRGWVYVQTGEAAFTRREVPLDHPVEKGWFVAKGFASDERVVVTGAQSLLSEEAKGSMQAD